MGLLDPPEPREISERKLRLREADCRAEGCRDCHSEYLRGFLDTQDYSDNGWTLVCSNPLCGVTHDLWEAQAQADDDDYEND